MVRPPSRSPSTPIHGAASVPRNWSEPKAVRSRTEPVSTIKYQPSTSVSISKAHDVRRSARHWKRKLRTRNAGRVNGRRFLVRHFSNLQCGGPSGGVVAARNGHPGAPRGETVELDL